MHISIDPEMNMHAIEITDCESSDIAMFNQLIPSGIEINKLIADGGYYSIAGVEKLNSQGITPVIPPPKHSVLSILPIIQLL